MKTTIHTRAYLVGLEVRKPLSKETLEEHGINQTELNNLLDDGFLTPVSHGLYTVTEDIAEHFKNSIEDYLCGYLKAFTDGDLIFGDRLDMIEAIRFALFLIDSKEDPQVVFKRMLESKRIEPTSHDDYWRLTI